MTLGIAIEQLTAQKMPEWDAFVRQSPEATFFHLSGWKTAIEQAFRHSCPYFVVRQNRDIVGVMPLSQVKSLLFGHHLSSTAFAVYGGPLALNEDAAAALSRAAVAMADSLNVDFLEIRSIECSQSDWETRTDAHATFRKSIAGNPEDLLKAIPRKQRAVVRKALERALWIELDDGIDRFYPLYAESVRNLGTPVFAKGWFAALKQVFGSACEIAIVMTEDGPVASLMSFYFRDEVLPYYAGGAPVARRLGAHDFMYYDLMCRAVERGCTSFDFGRSKTGSGPYAFKKNFGFEPQPLAYEYYLPKGGALPDISPNNPKFRWMTSLWSKLPLPVANFVGPMVSRGLG